MAQSILSTTQETTQILQRYDFMHAHSLVYNYEELKEIGVEPEFLLAVLEVFEDRESFCREKFDRFGLLVIVDYLRKTHTYYLHKKLLEIEQSIHHLVSAYPIAHPILLLLRNFYTDYKSHLKTHIEMEERELLPYISQLGLIEKGIEVNVTAPTLTIAQFMYQHHDTEKDLEDVRKAILHYSPPVGSQTLYRILLSQLEVFEKDLAVHALMEDEVLLPRALELEKKFKK